MYTPMYIMCIYTYIYIYMWLQRKIYCIYPSAKARGFVLQAQVLVTWKGAAWPGDAPKFKTSVLCMGYLDLLIRGPHKIKHIHYRSIDSSWWISRWEIYATSPSKNPRIQMGNHDLGWNIFKLLIMQWETLNRKYLDWCVTMVYYYDG